jgi:hypothetical protein
MVADVLLNTSVDVRKATVHNYYTILCVCVSPIVKLTEEGNPIAYFLLIFPQITQHTCSTHIHLCDLYRCAQTFTGVWFKSCSVI